MPDFLERLFGIGEINVEVGLRYASGDNAIYFGSLQVFHEKILDECRVMASFLEANDLKTFGITVHSVKSMLTTIGALDLADRASHLETAAKEENNDYCQVTYPDLQDDLELLYDDMKEIFPVAKDSATVKTAGTKNLLLEKLEKAMVACTDFDNETAIDILKELKEYTFGEEADALISDSVNLLKDFNIDGAETKLKKIIMDNL